MRRLLAAAGLLVLLGAPAAFAQSSNGYSGAWSDPAPSGSNDGTPVAYIDAQQTLTGQVSHPNGISRVDAVIVPDSSHPAPDGCDATLSPLSADQSGTSVTFHVPAQFPCNLVYHVRASAKANSSGPISSPPPAYQLPLDVAVAIPPAPVGTVTATVASDGDDRAVGLDWPANSEPDLLGYVVTRSTGSTTKTLGQIDAGDPTRFTDDDPPSGRSSRYEVTAIRRGPDDEVKQVAAAPTTVTVDVPSRRTDSASSGSGSGSGSGASEGNLHTVVTGQPTSGRPDPKLLSSVRARGGSGNGRPTPPTTFDSGFQEALPFKAGDPAVVAPASGSNAAVAVFDEGDGNGGLLNNKPTLTFIAGGLAVLVGAAVIFYVTRRAAIDAY